MVTMMPGAPNCASSSAAEGKARVEVELHCSCRKKMSTIALRQIWPSVLLQCASRNVSADELRYRSIPNFKQSYR